MTSLQKKKKLFKRSDDDDDDDKESAHRNRKEIFQVQIECRKREWHEIISDFSFLSLDFHNSSDTGVRMLIKYQD